MKWLLVFASVTTCVSARPSQRPSGDVEAPGPPGQNMSRWASCDNVNRTLADSARSPESRSSRSRSRQTANRSSEATPEPTSSAPSVTLNLTSEDSAAFPGLSSRESDPPAAGVVFSSARCLLATCSIADLGSKLQAGEETAGASARDSGGFGKK
ncbi:uncharacterized protein zgc:193726 [Hippocampus zosterae]|uniref:uncharacterized protein zgc:193726 n=1 Tax=Hippocampus zosterae TaxID=109293 RepID=UPI00223E3B14|nr:uncharacterized protein zgc:193726 [Hippocampus zosterae]